MSDVMLNEYVDGLKAETNSYFEQIFSGKLAIDATVQMLARFKDSSTTREQHIYECMIQYLFEEYKFFHNYPEKQLKIAAVLIGSLIKSQLITDLTLAISLSGVLDALHQPKESKMFTFGTEALKVFSDRLAEWPHYCKTILQISHFHGTHPELVAVVEGALARNSSGHLELNGTSTAPTEPHISSTLSTLENVEELGAVALSLPSTLATEHLGSSISKPPLSMLDVLDKYQILAQKLKTLVTKDSREAEIQGVIVQIPEMILKCANRDEVALTVAQKVLKCLYENASNGLHVSAHLAILTAIRDVCKLVVEKLTSWVKYSDDKRKFNMDIIVGLIHNDLLNLAEYDMHMAELIDAGMNKPAVEFAISLLQTLLVHESRVKVSELPNIVVALAKLVVREENQRFLRETYGIQKKIHLAQNVDHKAPHLKTTQPKGDEREA